MQAISKYRTGTSPYAPASTRASSTSKRSRTSRTACRARRGPPARKDISEDSPLRGFILCEDCRKPLTACWSQGKRQKYPYYLCATRGCPSHRKSIRREEIEGEFEALLQELQPAEGLFRLAGTMFRDAWNQRRAQSVHALKSLQDGIAGIEKQIETLLDRIVEATTDSVVSAYEKRIAALEREKALAAEKLVSMGRPRYTFEDSFEHAMMFLANPWKIWASGRLTLKRTVLRLAFADRISYCRNHGLRTPEIAMPFKALAEIQTGKCEMASPRGPA